MNSADERQGAPAPAATCPNEFVCAGRCSGDRCAEIIAADDATEAAEPADPTAIRPRDAVVYFRDGKLLAVETAAGTFSLADLKARKLLSAMDGMVLGQLAGRVDTLIGQLA